MNLTRIQQTFGGITIALLLTLLTLGGFNTALREISSTLTKPAQTLVSPSQQPNAPFTLRPSQPTHTPIPPPTPTNCPPPQGWVAHIVQTEDTLNTLANQTGTTPNEIIAANCLYSNQPLIPGSILYVPPQPTLPPPTPIPCGPPPGWVRYTVQSGDTLYRLSLNFGVSISQLQVANCLGSSIYIQAGQNLFVPNIPTRTPSPSSSPSPTATATATPSPSPSATLPAPTETATLTAPPATFTNTPQQPTLTPTLETDTPTLPPVTNTPTPTFTPEPVTETPTPTDTPEPTATLTATPQTITPTLPPPSETASPTPEPATITPSPTP